MPSNAELTTWSGTDWARMRAIWGELAGSPDSEGAPQLPRFNGESLTPQQSGYVFQTWIVEAFRLSQAEIESPFNVPVNPGIDNRIQHQIDGNLPHSINLLSSMSARRRMLKIYRQHLSLKIYHSNVHYARRPAYR